MMGDLGHPRKGEIWDTQETVQMMGVPICSRSARMMGVPICSLKALMGWVAGEKFDSVCAGQVEGPLMIAGDKNQFAVQIDIEDSVDGWIFGTYLFWVKGSPVGQVNDHAVDLKGCLNWMRDFIAGHRNRFEPELYGMDKEKLYTCLARSVLARQNPGGFAREVYEDTFSRFHISHIGMSSFDNVTVFLVKDEEGMERLIWRTGEGGVEDAYLAKNAMEDAFGEAVSFLQERVTSVAKS